MLSEYFKEIGDIIKDYKKNQEKDGLLIKTIVHLKISDFNKETIPILKNN